MSQDLLTLARGVGRQRLEKAIEALSPEHRIVFVLHDIEGYSPEKIADAMGSSVLPGSVRVALGESRRRLQDLLSKHIGVQQPEPARKR